MTLRSLVCDPCCSSRPGVPASTGVWVSVAWSQAEAWCSEEVSLLIAAGMMGQRISLGDLAPFGAGGLIGGKMGGTTDWRYCKTIGGDGDPDRLAYWDGFGWRAVPQEFAKTNPFGARLYGFAVWTEKEQGKVKVKTQYGKLPLARRRTRLPPRDGRQGPESAGRARDRQVLHLHPWVAPKPGRYELRMRWRDYDGPVEPLAAQTPFMPVPSKGPSFVGSGPFPIRGCCRAAFRFEISDESR